MHDILIIYFRARTIQGSFDSVRFRFKMLQFGFLNSIQLNKNQSLYLSFEIKIMIFTLICRFLFLKIIKIIKIYLHFNLGSRDKPRAKYISTDTYIMSVYIFPTLLVRLEREYIGSGLRRDNGNQEAMFQFEVISRYVVRYCMYTAKTLVSSQYSYKIKGAN